MKRILSWVLGLPAAILLIGFAVANRTFVDVSLDPFDRDNPSVYLHLPLWSVLMLGLFLGLVTGWILSWVRQGRWRRHARELRHENERLRIELTRLRADIEERAPGTAQDAGLIGTI